MQECFSVFKEYSWLVIINFLKDKVISLRDIVSPSKIKILWIDKTKLDASFLDTHFEINEYQSTLFRKDWDSEGGEEIVFTQNGIIAKKLAHFESSSI